MLTWKEVLQISSQGNLQPDRRVVKSDADWKSILTPEQFRIARLGGTERSFSHDSCRIFEPGLYSCVCCGQKLFDSSQKFDSGTGWPSFTQPVSRNAIAYLADHSHGMVRVEVRCNVCDAHLGHVFPDGPAPSGLRFCINGLALKKVENSSEETGNSVGSEHSTFSKVGGLATVVFGGGCFWCTEATFQRVRGVHSVVSGYCGGASDKPTYEDVCSGQTGHAEVVQVTYDPQVVSLQDLLTLHLCTHDPTTLNQQGADHGTQYRSVIFHANQQEQVIAEIILAEIESAISKKVVTQICPASTFYPAEPGHQDYYNRNRSARYCALVIEPKLEHLRKHFRHLIEEQEKT